MDVCSFSSFPAFAPFYYGYDRTAFSIAGKYWEFIFTKLAAAANSIENKKAPIPPESSMGAQINSNFQQVQRFTLKAAMPG
jgi:hypothetical protein